MKKFLLSALVILAAAVVIGACFFAQKQQRPSFQWEPEPRAVLKHFQNAHDPKISIAVSGDILLLAVGRDPHAAQLQLFISHDGGDTFAPGVPVSEKGVPLDSHGDNSPVLVSGQRGPAVLWDQPGPGGSQMMCAHSMDDGASFSKPVQVNDGGAKGSAYLGHMTASGKSLFAAWLDGRDHAHDGTTSIYFARSADGGATWQKNVRVATDVCPCCRPNVAVLPDGHVVVIWRKVFPGQIRDMACAVSADGGATWSAPRRVAVDNWHIMGCPVSGPQLVLSGKRLFAAWYSEGTGKNPGVRLSWSDDEGATWRTPVIASLPLLDAMQPYLYAGSGSSVYLAFRARDPRKGESWSQLRTYVVEVRDGGQVSAPMPAPGQDPVAYPAIAADKLGRVWVVWNGGKTIQFLRGRERAF